MAQEIKLQSPTVKELRDFFNSLSSAFDNNAVVYPIRDNLYTVTDIKVEKTDYRHEGSWLEGNVVILH